MTDVLTATAGAADVRLEIKGNSATSTLIIKLVMHARIQRAIEMICAHRQFQPLKCHLKHLQCHTLHQTAIANVYNALCCHASFKSLSQRGLPHYTDRQP